MWIKCYLVCNNVSFHHVNFALKTTLKPYLYSGLSCDLPIHIHKMLSEWEVEISTSSYGPPWDLHIWNLICQRAATNTRASGAEQGTLPKVLPVVSAHIHVDTELRHHIFSNVSRGRHAAPAINISTNPSKHYFFRLKWFMTKDCRVKMSLRRKTYKIQSRDRAVSEGWTGLWRTPFSLQTE